MGLGTHRRGARSRMGRRANRRRARGAVSRRLGRRGISHDFLPGRVSLRRGRGGLGRFLRRFRRLSGVICLGGLCIPRNTGQGRDLETEPGVFQSFLQRGILGGADIGVALGLVRLLGGGKAGQRVAVVGVGKHPRLEDGHGVRHPQGV